MIKKLLILFTCLITTANAFAVKCPTKAKSAYLIDYESGKELCSKEADKLMPPSSMLKLMTLAVLFEEIKQGNIKLDDKITASENSNYKDPLWYSASKMCLVPGQKVSVKDAILAIIVLSAGDASVAVAEKLAGTESQFTEMMTNYARKIGMEQSSFGNSSGLPNKNNLTTSKELAILAKHIIDEYPEMYPMFSTQRFEFKDTETQWCKEWARTHTLNYNKLLFPKDKYGMAGVDGMKTGHTDDGGFGMVASSKIGGRRLIGVINGLRADDHNALAMEMKKLINYGYDNTQTKILYKAGDKLAEIPVWYGSDETVIATVKNNLAVTIDKGEKFEDSIKVLVYYDNPIVAPVKQGQEIGYITVQYNGKQIQTIPLIAKDRVKKVQGLTRIFKNLSVIFLGK